MNPKTPLDPASPDPVPVDSRAVRFTCQSGCIRCCDQRGYVYLTEQDLVRIASFLSLAPLEFEARYVYRTQHLLRLRKPRNSQCHFLEQHGCSIHPAKPTQCRTFPFWPDLFADPEKWAETAEYCPGIGTGDFVPVEIVEQSLLEMREADER